MPNQALARVQAAASESCEASMLRQHASAAPFTVEPSDTYIWSSDGCTFECEDGRICQ